MRVYYTYTMCACMRVLVCVSEQACARACTGTIRGRVKSATLTILIFSRPFVPYVDILSNSSIQENGRKVCHDARCMMKGCINNDNIGIRYCNCSRTFCSSTLIL